MNCDKDKLLLFWAEELSEDEMDSVRMHLLKCPECRNEFIEMQELSRNFSHTLDEPAPRDFVAEAARKTRGGRVLFLEAFKKPLVLFPSLGGLAAAAAVMFVLYSPWTPMAPTVHDKSVTISESPLVAFITAKKHMMNRRLLSNRHRFTGKGSLQARAVELKAKVKLAKRNMNII